MGGSREPPPHVFHPLTGDLPLTDLAVLSTAATFVPEARRVGFLPELFGRRLMLKGEQTVYSLMSWLSPQDYTGGLWNFHELNCVPLFLSPATDKRFRITCETNGYQGEVSAEAAGIIATLFALSHLSFQHDADTLSDSYFRLYTFAGDHPEAEEIFQAID